MSTQAAGAVAITDVFDALSSERPYKEAMSLKRVVEILEEGRNKYFDPDLLTSFPACHRHPGSGNLPFDSPSFRLCLRNCVWSIWTIRLDLRS